MTLPQWALDARKLREAATPGPWRATQTPWPRIIQTNHITRDIREIADLGDHYGIPTTRQVEEDASFIAAAPTNQELLERALELALTALSEAGNYLHWHTDDLSGDDLVGDGRRTRSFNRITSEIEQAIAQIHALGGSDAT